MLTSVRLDSETESVVRRLARKSGRTKSQVIRDAIRALASSEGGRSTRRPYEAFSDVIGCARGGPPDLSERTGEKFSKLLMGRVRS